MNRTLTRAQFLWLATLFEGSLGLTAFMAGAASDIDPLLTLQVNLPGAIVGLLGTLPLYAAFLQSQHFDRLREVREFLTDKLGGILAVCRWHELLYVGLLAGVTEELLFRGFLQPWLEQHWGWLGGLVFSNLIFALVHWISPLYGLLAGICGLYLGLMLDVGGERNLLIPILIHSLYDFLAFMVVAEAWRSQKARRGD